MAPVYQRRATAAFVLTSVVTLLAGCAGAGDSPAPAPPPRSWPLAVYLGSLSYEPVGVDARGRLVATESGPAGERAVRVALGGLPDPVAPHLRRSHRALAALAGDAVVLELAAGDDGTPAALAIAEGGLVPAPLASGAPGERFLAAATDGERFWSALPSALGHEALVETSRIGRTRRTVLEAPPGFRLAALAGDGLRVAMAREVAPGSDEVVVTDRVRGESRLVLPTGPEGRFRPLLFSPGGDRLLVATGDASDLPRLEWLALPSGERALALDSPCAAVGASSLGGVVVADLACDGRRRVSPLDGAGLPWTGTLPSGLEPFAALPAGGGAWWLGLAGPRSARDLARISSGRDFEPLTWGLAPRLDPGVLPTPAIERLRSGGIELPVEIWRPTAAAVGAVVWLESDAAPPAWGEFHPLFAGLAANGIAVARLRPRGAGGFGRAVREAAGDDPLAAARDDAEAALARLRAASAAPQLPAVRVAEGTLGVALGEGEGAAAAPFAVTFAAPALPSRAALGDAGRRVLERLRGRL